MTSVLWNSGFPAEAVRKEAGNEGSGEHPHETRAADEPDLAGIQLPLTHQRRQHETDETDVHCVEHPSQAARKKEAPVESAQRPRVKAFCNAHTG